MGDLSDGTIHIPDLARWPTVRDATRLMNVSSVWVSHLIRCGKLCGVKTRLGYFLIEPESLERCARERQARLAAKRARE